MKLYYHKDPLGNFGDDLNPWLMERLLPGFFDGHCHHDPKMREAQNESDPLFVGIGTILNHHVPTKPMKAVFGSGAGYGPAPSIDDTWRIYCVRGPRTAETLGLSPDKAITDAAVLCRKVDLPTAGKKHKAAFMPHCSTARHGCWRLVCEDMDIHYIDPQWSVDDVFASLLATDLLITEAMHGAILADALRIPWTPVTTTAGVLSVKWWDWCMTLDMDYTPWRLPSLWAEDGAGTWPGRLVRGAKFAMARRALGKILKKGRPQLSSEPLLDSLVDRLEGQLELFKTDVREGRYAECKGGI